MDRTQFFCCQYTRPDGRPNTKCILIGLCFGLIISVCIATVQYYSQSAIERRGGIGRATPLSSLLWVAFGLGIHLTLTRYNSTTIYCQSGGQLVRNPP